MRYLGQNKQGHGFECDVCQVRVHLDTWLRRDEWEEILENQRLRELVEEVFVSSTHGLIEFYLEKLFWHKVEDKAPDWETDQLHEVLEKVRVIRKSLLDKAKGDKK